MSLGELYGAHEALWIALQFTLCQVCAPQHDFLEDLHDRCSGRGVGILLVLGDEAASPAEALSSGSCAAFVEDAGLPFPIVRDEAFAESGELAARGVPTQVLLDSDFRIRAVDQGWDPSFQEERMEGLVEDILAEQEASP